MNWAINSKKKLEEAKKSLGLREGPHVQWLKEKENDKKLRICDWRLKNGLPTLNQSLADWDCGVACLAGKPNSGKSTTLVNMMMQACQLNDDILIVDITLDDPFKKRYEQYVAAMTGLYYQEITTKVALSDVKMTAKEEAHNQLEQWYDADKLRTIEAVERITSIDGQYSSLKHFRKPEEIFRLLKDAREQYPTKTIVFFIDAWNNLDVSGARASSDLSQANYFLACLQEEANAHNIMVMLSAHLRKSERGQKRPGLEDIKGTSDMAYNVVWAGIVRNELRENAIKNPMTITEDDKIYPVMAIEVVKTKVSTWDMPLMYVLKSGQCTISPLHEFQYKEYLDKYLGRK